MSKKEKREFVLQNRSLPLEELAGRTGLSPRQVRKIIERPCEKVAELKEGAAREPGTHRDGWALVLVVLITVLVYIPSLNNGFVNWDDSEFIVKNLHIRHLDFASIRWMLNAFYCSNWIPLTWFSLALNFWMGGLDPRIYHLTNLILHALNTGLVFLVCRRILNLAGNRKETEGNPGRGRNEVKAAFLAALLFGIHPLHVESVAWATERKDVLCGFLYLGGLLLYLDYASSARGKGLRLAACLGLFSLALVSKPMAVSFPLVLFLLDFWPLGRFSKEGAKVYLEKIPFFIASLLCGWLTVLSQFKGEAVLKTQDIPLGIRVMNAFHSLVFYVEKMIFPSGLAAFYPITEKTKAFSAGQLLCVGLAVLWAGICLYWLKRRPYLAAGSLYYFITLLPVLGILQAGFQTSADRYTYLPSLGPFLLFAYLAVFILSKRRFLFPILAAGLTAGLGYGTFLQSATWKDSIALWENAVRVHSETSVITYSELGNAYQDAGHYDEAIRAFDQAIAADPAPSAPYDSKGTCLFSKGLAEDAAAWFKTSIEKDPKNAIPHSNLSKVYQKSGNYDEALAEAQKAVQLDPDLASAYNNLGVSYWYLKQPEKSFAAYQKAVSLDPDNQSYLVNLANLYAQGGNYAEAAKLYQEGISADPNEVIYYLNLGFIDFQSGKFPEALDLLRRASSLQPDNPGIYQKLGLTYRKMGREDLAEENFRKAKVLAEHSRH